MQMKRLALARRNAVDIETGKRSSGRGVNLDRGFLDRFALGGVT